MKRIKIVGLCLVAVFAFTAVAAGSAFASGRPEYKVCSKTPKVGNAYPTGEFSNKECTDAAGGGKYRLESVKGTFTSKSKAATFTADGKVIVCKKDSDSGEITSQFTSTEKITFTDCYVNGVKKDGECGNVATSTIETEPLEGQLFFTNEGETENGVGLLNEESGIFASFKCGAETITIEGGVLGSIKNSSKGEVITFAVNGSGEQATKGVWFHGSMILELSLTAGGKEATMATIDEQGPKDVGAFS